MPTRSKRLKVKDKPGLERDSFSKAVINTDRSNYAAARARKKMLAAKEERIQSLEVDIAELKNSYESLLTLVKSIAKTRDK